MALIERYIVTASSIDVASGASIKEGQFVSLNASGEAVLQAAAANVVGISADTKSNSASSMEGVYEGWTNRVSDYFDDTKASSKITVYHSGGEFAIDQYEAGVASANAGTLLYAKAGLLSTDSSAAAFGPVAMLLQPVGAYMSGVPGVDVNGDMALKGENDGYAVIKLLI